MLFQKPIAGMILAALLLLPCRALAGDEMLPDITGTYQFLSADDSLGLLEEEGRLRGYVDVLQGEEESDAILSYSLEGTRKVNRVEFKTKTIHRKYYRFSGRVERGDGATENDADYLRLRGSLEIVTVDPDTGKESVERQSVVFKSQAPEKPEDEEE
jgi:hypothetical protein